MANVLVVDDTPINLDLLTHAVEEMGYDTIEATNGEEAIRIIDEKSVDLVLLDYLLPDMEGIEVLKHIRKHYTSIELPVIIVTSFYETSKVIEAIRHGANDYIHKPYDFEVLQARIESNLLLKFAEQALQVARDEAIAANEAKTDYLSMVNHELRTPLTSILGYCTYLHSEMVKNNDSRYVELLQRIQSASNRLLSLTNDLLDIAMIESGDIEIASEPVTINDLLRQCASEVQPIIEKNQNTLHFNIDTDYAVMTDQKRLGQIIINVLGNAAKFTNKGRIDIFIKPGKEPVEGKLDIVITDTGIGIPENKLNQVFSRFGRLHDKSKSQVDGIGLGLMISKQLAQRLNGDLLVESTEGKGSTFTISLKTGKSTVKN
ncbi:MAG: response regulator [Gammaproteobacteria bacterium]|nr:response regulator [Gammaproteobacteria bacterium]